MRRVAQRISQTSPKSFGMYEKAEVALAQGRDLIRLEFGRPWADTPLHIKQAAVAALMDGKVHYDDPRGTRDLRAVLADKLTRQNAIPTDPDSVLVTNGMSHATYIAFMALLDRGDEVIVLCPHYPQHIAKIELAGGVPVLVDLEAAQDYTFDAATIGAAITDRTRAILLVNPANPTGRVYRRDELQVLADIALARDLVVISDEIYEGVIYGGAPHVSIAALDGMADRTVSMFAFTKSHAMDGWRIGYLTAPDWLLPAIMKVSTSDITHVNTFIQSGAVAAVTGPVEPLDELLDDDHRKRDFAVAALNQMPGVRCAEPQATIFAFPDITGTGIQSQALAEMILDRADVVVEAGSFHGPAGEGHLRLSFGSVSMDDLEEAMRRLGRFFNSL